MSNLQVEQMWERQTFWWEMATYTLSTQKSGPIILAIVQKYEGRPSSMTSSTECSVFQLYFGKQNAVRS